MIKYDYSHDKYFNKDNLIGKYISPGNLDELDRPIGPAGWVDLGDTLQRCGSYALLCWAKRELYPRWNEPVTSMNAAKPKHYCGSHGYLDTRPEDFYKQSALLECYNGYRRGNDPDFWYYDCDRGSRDQEYPMLAAHGALGNTKEVTRYAKTHAKRGFLFTHNNRRNGTTAENHGQVYKHITRKKYYFFGPEVRVAVKRNYNWKPADLTFFSFWSLYFRAIVPKKWYTKLLFCPLISIILHILDLEFLVNSLLYKYVRKDEDDIVNHLNEAIYSNFRYPTITSVIANEINDSEDMKKRVMSYYKMQNSMPTNPYFIGILYLDMIDEVMRD